MLPTAFYDQLTPFYHLIYQDWGGSVKRQAAALDSIIQEIWGDAIHTILDVACGIGTQALGLARLGYRVTASDLSSSAIERARREAATRGLEIELSVADMREAYTYHQRQFDLVMACDNAIPHLLTDEEILHTFEQLYACVRPGGGCLISVRDYAAEDCSGIQVKPYGIRMAGQTRYLVFQVWEFRGELYDLAMYFVEDQGGAHCTTHVMRATYYAVRIDRLIALMAQAGFQQVQRIDQRFFQPVIIGSRL